MPNGFPRRASAIVDGPAAADGAAVVVGVGASLDVVDGEDEGDFEVGDSLLPEAEEPSAEDAALDSVDLEAVLLLWAGGEALE